MTMSADPELFRFPELSDEAVLALERLIEELYHSFQNHYFAQLHRCSYPARLQRDPCNDQLNLPLQEDPPF
jgi:hypothetical protein